MTAFRLSLVAVFVVVLSLSCGPSVPQDSSAPEVDQEALRRSTHHHGQPWRDPATLHNAAAPAGAHLTYYGGRVVSNMQVVEVIYGTGSYLSQVTSTTSPNIGTFYQGVLNSAYVDWLTEYNTTTQSGTHTNQTIGRGSFASRVTITPASSRNGTTITDANIQAELAAQITAGTLPAPTHDAAGNNNTSTRSSFRTARPSARGAATPA